MTEFAIIDVGSNSIRYGRELGGSIPEKQIFTTRLGSGLSETGMLADQTMERSLEVIRGLCQDARQEGLFPVAYATSAVRDAGNGREFAARIEAECGCPVRILTGEQEARYAFMGAVGGEGRYDTMLDIGGASMQVVTADFGVSFRAGCVRCGDIARKAVGAPDCDSDPRAQREAVVDYMDGQIVLPELHTRRLVGVGGTITTLAALSAGLTEFSADAVEQVVLTRCEVERLIDRLCAMGDGARSAHPLLRARHDVILYGAYIFAHALELIGVDECGVSCADGMEGFLRILKQDEKI